MTACQCLFPSIVCRAIDDDAQMELWVDRPSNHGHLQGEDGGQQLRDTQRTAMKGGVKNDGHRSAGRCSSSCRPWWCGSRGPPRARIWAAATGSPDAAGRRDREQHAQHEFEDNLYSDDRQERGVRWPQMRPVGKADKPPVWKGSSVERWTCGQ